MLNSVQALQDKLSHAAKQSLDRRFGALYDKLYRRDVLEEAWRRVRANKGAPGIDEQSFEYIEEEIGVEAFLDEIEQELKAKTYRPLPVKRCWIDKPGKPEKRPLGIPVIKDRRGPDGGETGDGADLRDELSAVFLRLSSRARCAAWQFARSNGSSPSRDARS